MRAPEIGAILLSARTCTHILRSGRRQRGRDADKHFALATSFGSKSM